MSTQDRSDETRWEKVIGTFSAMELAHIAQFKAMYNILKQIARKKCDLTRSQLVFLDFKFWHHSRLPPQTAQPNSFLQTPPKSPSNPYDCLLKTSLLFKNGGGEPKCPAHLGKRDDHEPQSGSFRQDLCFNLTSGLALTSKTRWKFQLYSWFIQISSSRRTLRGFSGYGETNDVAYDFPRTWLFLRVFTLFFPVCSLYFFVELLELLAIRRRTTRYFRRFTTKVGRFDI